MVEEQTRFDNCPHRPNIVALTWLPDTECAAGLLAERPGQHQIQRLQGAARVAGILQLPRGGASWYGPGVNRTRATVIRDGSWPV
jgi:hypothetical protein